MAESKATTPARVFRRMRRWNMHGYPYPLDDLQREHAVSLIFLLDEACRESPALAELFRNIVCYWAERRHPGIPAASCWTPLDEDDALTPDQKGVIRALQPNGSVCVLSEGHQGPHKYIDVGCIRVISLPVEEPDNHDADA